MKGSSFVLPVQKGLGGPLPYIPYPKPALAEPRHHKKIPNRPGGKGNKPCVKAGLKPNTALGLRTLAPPHPGGRKASVSYTTFAATHQPSRLCVQLDRNPNSRVLEKRIPGHRPLLTS